MNYSIKKTIAMVMALVMTASMAGCTTTKNSKAETATDSEAVTTETTTITAIKAVTETLPSETVYVVETVAKETTATTTVPVTEETEESTTTTAPEEEEIPEIITTYPIVTYPSQPQTYTPPQTVYVYVTEPKITETTPPPVVDPTEDEAIEIAKKGFAGLVYSDDERILNYTNVDLYCQLVGGYNLDAVNENNSKLTIDLNDARKQFASRWTSKLSSVEFTKCTGKMTKGEVQAYNKKLREIYSGGDVLNIKTGFLNEITDAYKIEFTYDLMKSGEHIYGENPYMLVVKIDDKWVLDICKPLLEEVTDRTEKHNAAEEQKKKEEEERKAEEERQKEEQKKKEEEQKKREEEWKKAQEEAKKRDEEIKKEQEERQKKIDAYNKAKMDFWNEEQEFLRIQDEYNAATTEFEAYTAEYEEIYNKYMMLLSSGELTKDDPAYLYYTTYIRDYEKAKRDYEKIKSKYEAALKKYEKAKTDFNKIQYDFVKEFGWAYA